MVPLVSVPFRGRAQGRAQGRRNATRTQGGVWQKESGGCGTKRVHLSLSPFVFFVLNRTTRDAPAGSDWTGATPHF